MIFHSRPPRARRLVAQQRPGSMGRASCHGNLGSLCFVNTTTQSSRFKAARTVFGVARNAPRSLECRCQSADRAVTLSIAPMDAKALPTAWNGRGSGVGPQKANLRFVDRDPSKLHPRVALEKGVSRLRTHPSSSTLDRSPEPSVASRTNHRGLCAQRLSSSPSHRHLTAGACASD